MANKGKAASAKLDKLLAEASWLLSHAEALGDYRRSQEAAQELERAAAVEDEVASLLDAARREGEAAIHRVSAASCFEQLGKPARALTLLRAALSADLPADYRQRVETQLARLLARAGQPVKQKT
jgi:hypothetical protein